MPGDKSRANGAKGGRPKGAPDNPESPRVLKRAALRAKVLRSVEMSADATLEQIRRCGFYDIRRLFDGAGNLRPIKELSEAEAACIAGIDVVKRRDGDDVDTVLKVKLTDRGRYLEMAAKAHGLLKEKVEHSGGVSVLIGPTDADL